MERAPSRAKAANILRPASRAQEQPAPARNGVGDGAPFGMSTQPLPLQQQQPTRVLAGGARVIGPSDGSAQVGAGLLRRTPSAAQVANRQQPPGNRQRVSSYYEGMATGDMSAMPRAASRSGSRADFGPAPMTPQPQQPPQMQPQQHQFPLSPSRGGWTNAAPGGMWLGQGSQMPMNTLFGGGFGTMGMGHVPASAGISGAMGMGYVPVSAGIPGTMSPVSAQHFPGGLPPPMMGMPSSRPGSSLQHAHPSRPATSTGFHGAGPDSDSPVLVNVARGGARVIGPMRAKQAAPEGPAFLNPIPQSPSSALDGMLPGAPHGAGVSAARDNIRSALSNNSLESGRSRSNSALRPIEESMEAAEARVSRKIQDLKITNESLLVVNAQLENRVKSQGKLISDLRKQLQSRDPFVPDPAADGEVSDEALRSAMKEDKVFERLISNLERLIQDTKDALEYRSTVAAGKVISAAELDEAPADDAQEHSPSGSESGEDEEDKNEEGEGGDKGDKPVEDAKAEAGADGSAEAAGARQQEARELVARLMVLALSSPDPASPEKPPSRIPKQGQPAGAGAAGIARAQSATKAGLRAPAKSSSSRISSFGVASANTPVRPVVAGPDSSKEAAPAASDREQILDICRRLQQLM